ncbi:MAG: glycosyltransferase family 2 protein [Bacteroidetes bacterium]|jgi:hypothetical protein|nr:glycosyltransferase family 2 protein [Bacteroidota bacterium]
MQALAPIILFVYNRPEHTLRTLESLEANSLSADSDLYIFADGPKRPEDKDLCEQIRRTREVIHSKKWCRNVHVTESTVNKGLSVSVVEGVSAVIGKQGTAIVLEDDHVTSPYFLQFMNDALLAYRDEQEVACISGYIYPVKGKLPETFFLKGADCWGWATWKDRWDLYRSDGQQLLEELEKKELNPAFDFDNTYPYTQMLRDQIAGKNDSWAIRWYAAAFLAGKYCLYPGVSLVKNIGTDGSGIHSGFSDRHDVQLSQKKIRVEKIPVKEDRNAKESVKKYFTTLGAKPGMMKKIKDKIKSIVKK